MLAMPLRRRCRALAGALLTLALTGACGEDLYQYCCYYEVQVGGEEAGALTLYKAGECDLCLKGYLGRTGIFELLLIDDETRRRILDKASSTEIKQRAMEKGMRTLLADGRQKVLDGSTTIEELVRVCQRDEI